MGSDLNKDTVWYFAYGSNLSPEKFTQSRGIVPLASLAARIPGWKLSMSIPGLPYREPAFASIEPTHAIRLDEKQREVEVEGIAYLITRAQYVKLVGSEGGDIAYSQAELRAEPIHEVDVGVVGSKGFLVFTFINAIFKAPPGRPSLRYMDLIVSGAKTAPLTPEYERHLRTIPTYSQSRSLRNRTGAFLFLLFWSPVMTLMENIVKWTVDYERGGAAPSWAKTFVRFLVAAMWLSHEIHALVWGRGDGLDDCTDWDVAEWNAVDLERQRLDHSWARMPWTG